MLEGTEDAVRSLSAGICGQITVDGGATVQNTAGLWMAGASRLVVGNALCAHPSPDQMARLRGGD